MSTYNGEKYIGEQLDSIREQNYKDIKIFIRDDGSRDNTKKIIEEYNKKFPELFHDVLYEENCGAKKSFMKLIEKAPLNYKYFAFSDQDDIWKNDKIKKAVESIEKIEEFPTLYFSNYDIVDENLKYYRKGFINEKFAYTLQNAVIQTMGLGCTMVFNKKMMEIIRRKKINVDNIIMHDYWLYLLGTVFGKIIYDENSTLYYRQHGRNVSGSTLKIENKISNLLLRLNKNNSLEIYIKQIKEFYGNYYEFLGENEKKVIEKFIESKKLYKRIKNVIEKNVFFNNKNNKYVGKIRTIFYILGRT